MTSFTYTPDARLEIHEENAIRFLCAGFQSHESGIPEWVKNAADEYARRNIPEERRVIVLLFRDADSRYPATISCLDFAGMSARVIEENFRVWADPEAATRGCTRRDVQGGHGNGGKSYMTTMFDDHAVLRTVLDGRGCRYGVVAGSIAFGYVPDSLRGRDFIVGDLARELGAALGEIGLDLDWLPLAALHALRNGTGFTLVTGVNPKGYRGKIPVKKLQESLVDHPQMLWTIQVCQVLLTANGKALNSGRPLALPTITPMEGAEDPIRVRIPVHLTDPDSETLVSTTDDDSLPEGGLILRTSKSSFRYANKRARHAIVFQGRGGHTIGYVPVSELDIQSSYRDRIYGECSLESLERYKQNDRSRLADAPLTRAVREFIGTQIQRLAETFETRDKRTYSQNARNAVSEMNKALDRWKNHFLRETLGAGWGKGTPPSPPPLPGGAPDRIQIEVSNVRMGKGISMRPNLEFYKGTQRVRTVPFRWVSEDPNVAMVQEDIGVITSFSYGKTVVYAETLDGTLRSNTVAVEVVQIFTIRIEPKAIEVPLGSRSRLEATCTLADGSEARDIRLQWMEDDDTVAKVSSAGMVFGYNLGSTAVEAKDDSTATAERAIITVVEGKGGGGAGEGKGRGFPLILVSGEFDKDPDSEVYVHFSAEEPPVQQRPIDSQRNIWWINSAAPLATLYLDSKAHKYGYESREWRMYHVERYVDVIAQIMLRQRSDGQGSRSVDDWILEWGSYVAEIQKKAVSDLEAFIDDGTLPAE